MKKFLFLSLFFLNPVLAENPRSPFFQEPAIEEDFEENDPSETASIIADEINGWSGQSFYAYMFYGEKSLDDSDFLNELRNILHGTNVYVALYVDYASENLYKLVVSAAPFEGGKLYNPNQNFEDYCIDAEDEQINDVLAEFEQSIDAWNLRAPFSFDCAGATFFINDSDDDAHFLPLLQKANDKARAQNSSLYIKVSCLNEDPSVISTIDFSLTRKDGFVLYQQGAGLNHYVPSATPAPKRRRIV